MPQQKSFPVAVVGAGDVRVHLTNGEIIALCVRDRRRRPRVLYGLGHSRDGRRLWSMAEVNSRTGRVTAHVRDRDHGNWHADEPFELVEAVEEEE